VVPSIDCRNASRSPAVRGQLRLNRGRRRKPDPPAQPCSGKTSARVWLAAVQVRGVVVNTEQRRHVEPIQPNAVLGAVLSRISMGLVI